MNLSIAEKLATTQIERYCPDYTFKWDNAKRRRGLCSYSKRTIQMSRVFVSHNDAEQVMDTIMHEIAHALVGPGHGHGEVWKAKARQLGATPRACRETVAPPAPYVLRCECGEQRVPRHRRRKISGNARCCRKPFFYEMNREVFA